MRRQPCFALRPVKKLNPEATLKLAQSHGDGGLRSAKSLGCRRKTVELNNPVERFELL
jgi:hypothetical protein